MFNLRLRPRSYWTVLAIASASVAVCLPAYPRLLWGTAFAHLARSVGTDHFRPTRSDRFQQVALHSANRGAPYINLRDGESVASNYVGDSFLARSLRENEAQPLALATGDFDEDGMPDLISGYAAPTGTGIIALHRGNVDALWPYGDAAKMGVDPRAKTRRVPRDTCLIADSFWSRGTVFSRPREVKRLKGE